MNAFVETPVTPTLQANRIAMGQIGSGLLQPPSGIGMSGGWFRVFRLSSHSPKKGSAVMKESPIWRLWRDFFSKGLGFHNGNGVPGPPAFESGNEVTPAVPWKSIYGFGEGDENLLRMDVMNAFGSTRVPPPYIDPTDTVKKTVEQAELWALREGFDLAEVERILSNALRRK